MFVRVFRKPALRGEKRLCHGHLAESCPADDNAVRVCVFDSRPMFSSWFTRATVLNHTRTLDSLEKTERTGPNVVVFVDNHPDATDQHLDSAR